MNDFLALARDLGLPVDQAAGFEGLVVAAGIIAVAWAAGFVIARKIAPRIERLAGEREIAPGGIAARAGRIAGSLAALLVLMIGAGLARHDAFGILALAAATGFTSFYLVLQILRGFHMGSAFAGSAAGMTMVTVVAARLGGLSPLLDAMAEARIDAGKYSVSLLGIVNGIVIVGILLVLTRLLVRLSNQWIGSSSRLDVSQRVLFQKLAGLGLVAVAIFVGIDLLGIDLTALAVFSGALGLAIGFGMQKTFGNLLSGIILLMDRSIKPGDVIVIGDTFGTVNRIGIRAVSVLTRDGKEFLIPNEKLMTEQVENWSYSSRNVRVRIPVGVSYACDIRKAQELMLEAASAAPRVLKSPKPKVWLTGFGDNAVDHVILVWISDAEEGISSIRSAILNRLWDLFKENGIEIPFPQRDIHIRSVSGGVKLS